MLSLFPPSASVDLNVSARCVVWRNHRALLLPRASSPPSSSSLRLIYWFSFRWNSLSPHSPSLFPFLRPGSSISFCILQVSRSLLRLTTVASGSRRWRRRLSSSHLTTTVLVTSIKHMPRPNTAPVTILPSLPLSLHLWFSSKPQKLKLKLPPMGQFDIYSF